MGEPEQLGKATRQDREKLRPNLVDQLGLFEARRRLDELVAKAKQSIPPCFQRGNVEQFLSSAAARLCPAGLGDKAAARGVASGRR